MTARPYPRAVPDAPKKPEPPSLDYEWQARQRIARIDWAEVHVRGDRNQALELADRPKWKGWL